MKNTISLCTKTRVKSFLLLLLLPVSLSAQQPYTYENPVLRGVADAGCIRYAGKYYLGGVATNGDFFVSDMPMTSSIAEGFSICSSV